MNNKKKNNKEGNSKKIYWCQCTGENPQFTKSVKKGSVPKDTGKVCPNCGGKIFEEEGR